MLNFDNLLARLEERLPINSDVPAFPERYIEEIRAANYIRAASVDSTTLKRDLAKTEVQLAVIVDAYADFEQDIESPLR